MENKAQNARHPVGWRAFLTQFYAKSLDFKAVIPYEGSPKLGLFFIWPRVDIVSSSVYNGIDPIK